MANVSNEIFNKIIEYAKNDYATVQDRDKLAECIFEKLDTNHNGKLEKTDKMNDFYKKFFDGIDENALKEKINDIAYNMSFEKAPESDHVKNYKHMTLEELKKKKEQAYNSGVEVYEILDKSDCNTTDEDYDDINDDLNNVDKDNVLEFLEGFYSESEGKGILTFLDDEWDGGAIDIEGKMNIVKSILELAKEKGIESTDRNIRRINKIMKNYEDDGKYADKNGFDNNRRWTWTGIAKIGLLHYLNADCDNAVLDKAIRNLYNKMKNE